MRRLLRRLLPFVAAIVLLTASLMTAMADTGSYEHRYTESGESGLVAGGHQTTLFKLVDGNANTNFAYCVDFDVTIVKNSMYTRSNVEESGYYSTQDAAMIRSIVRNAYPFISLAELRTRAGISSLTSTQAITAAQLAIWNFSNNASISHANANVTALLAWYFRLAPMPDTQTPVGVINLSSTTEAAGDRCSVTYQYGVAGQNVDGSGIPLSFALDQDVVSLYGATVEELPTVGGVHGVRISNLPFDAVFRFMVSGTQNIAFDAYLYSPQGGRTASQSLIGAYQGDTTVYAEEAFSYQPSEYSIRIQKYDSTTGEGIQGAVFELSDNEGFVNPTVYEKTTDEDGYVEFTGLVPGRWYLREKTAPLGYVPDTGLYVYDIDDVPIDLVRFKNTHYGEIQILKVDPSDAPLAGATFNIYRGDSQDPADLLFEGLVTDETGLILKDSITPGQYTVVETKAPYGYHLAENPVQLITVNPHGSVSVKMVNPLVQRGRIGIAKENYETGERLAGALVGLYTDEACTELVKEITTIKEDFVYFDDLMPGTYYVKELAPPPGYILNPKQTVVTVELAEGATEAVIFRNRPRIDTAGNYGLLLLIGVCAMGATGVLLLAFRKRLFKR